MSGCILYCSESLFGGFLFLCLTLNVCATLCFYLRRKVEKCYECSTEGGRDGSGP